MLEDTQEEGFGYEEDDPTLDPAEEAPAPEEDENPYWAAAKAEDIASEIKERASEYYQALEEGGLLDLFKSAHGHFYGLNPQGSHETSKIVEFGVDGEKLGVRSNQLRSIIRYILTSTTADRPSLNPRAMNNTAAALAQVPTARRALEYYHKNKRMERKLHGVALRALLYGKGYLIQGWDASVGRLAKFPDQQDPATGATIPGREAPEGDLFAMPASPMEVAIDLERAADDHDWMIFRRPRNRYDAAATYAPAGQTKELDALRKDILSAEADFLDQSVASQIAFGLRKKDRSNSDILFEYHLMHRKTPAMPEGRYTIVLGEDLVVFDDALPYEDIPISEMIPEEFMEAGSVGYASAWDLIGMQQAYDALMSAAITNFDAFGHNDVLIPQGVELYVEELRDGLNVIRYPAGEFNKPSMLEKFSLKEEFFKLKDWMKGDMELVSGANSVARGEPEASLKSGAALALVQAQALHFQSGFMAAWSYLIEDSGTNTIRILKKYCEIERLSAVAGANDPDGLVAFKGSDMDQIDRVEVEQVNPIFKTLAGKFDVANNLLERGLILDVSQYFEVLETGRLEPVMDPMRQEHLFGEAVKEALMKGPEVRPKTKKDPLGQEVLDTDPLGNTIMHVPDLPVMITDNPLICLGSAKHVLLSVENRKNVKIVLAATTYIQEVLRTWRSAPADLLQLLGYPMPPPMPGTPEYEAMLAAGKDDPPKGKDEKSGPPGKGKPTPPNGKGEQDPQGPPDKGSGMPSLPKPAQPPPPAQL